MVNKYKKTGFTLIELTIAIGLLGLALTLTSGIILSVVSNATKRSALNDVERAGDKVLRIMEDSIRKSSDVQISPDNYLHVQLTDIDGNNENRFFGNMIDNTTCANNYVFMSSNDVASETTASGSKLTDSDVRVDAFQTVIVSSGHPIQVFVKMDVTSCKDDQISRTFQTFVTARSTYR